MEKNNYKLSDLGTKYQEMLGQIIFEEVIFSNLILDILEDNFIELSYVRIFLKNLKSFKKEYRTHPTYEIFKSYVKVNSKGFSKEDIRLTLEYIENISSVVLSDVDREYVKDSALKYCRKENVKKATLQFVECIENDTFEENANLITNALKIGLNNEIGMDYTQDIRERYETEGEQGIVPSGHEILDKITNGGYRRGELSLILGGTGVGKSIFLTNAATNFIKNGFNVLYYTLELSEGVICKRIDSCLTGIKLWDLTNPENLDIIETEVNSLPGKCIVKQYPTAGVTVSGLKAHYEKLKQLGMKFDVIIVDYAGILKTRGRSDEKRYSELVGIYQELRGIAVEENIVMISAAQLNRKGYGEQKSTLENTAESFGSLFVVDFALTISRPTIVENDECFYTIGKNRNGPDRITFKGILTPEIVKVEFLEREAEGKESQLSKGEEKKGLVSQIAEAKSAQIEEIDQNIKLDSSLINFISNFVKHTED